MEDVAADQHDAGEDAVEAAAAVGELLGAVTAAEAAEVLGSARDGVGEELDHDFADAG